MIAEQFEMRAPARPEAIAELRHELVRYAQSIGASRRVLDGLRLAVSEALTNAVVHAYVGREPGVMIVEASCTEDEHLVVHVCDEGHGLVPRFDSPGLGLGIGVMASMADEFAISNREKSAGTIVSLRFALLSRALCAS